MLVGIETELGDVILRIGRRDGLQDAYRNQILGMNECFAHAHGPFIFPIVIFRLPGRAAGLICTERQWRIIDDGGRRETLLERGGINKGFEAGAGLAPGLCDVIELIVIEVETAYQ